MAEARYVQWSVLYAEFGLTTSHEVSSRSFIFIHKDVGHKEISCLWREWVSGIEDM